jgi:DNA polymerase III sliding clamp (beta) subunit (PCNA family)
MKVILVLLIVGMMILPVMAEDFVTESVGETQVMVKETPIQTITTIVQESFGRVKPVLWKDNGPKLSKNKLVFESSIMRQIKVTDADNKNVTIPTTITNNQIDLPFDVSKPGKIAVRMQVGDIVYVIRRNV